MNTLNKYTETGNEKDENFLTALSVRIFINIGGKSRPRQNTIVE